MHDYDGYIRFDVPLEEVLESFPDELESVEIELLADNIYSISIFTERKWFDLDELTNILEYDFYIRDLETDAAYINKNYIDLRQRYIVAEFVDELMLLGKEQALEIVKQLDEKVQAW